MYATPALRDGKLIPVSMLCLDCGERLLFSHYEDYNKDTYFMLTSCPNGHTWQFAGGTNQERIQADVYGDNVDDTDPDWSAPAWVREMTEVDRDQA